MWDPGQKMSEKLVRCYAQFTRLRIKYGKSVHGEMMVGLRSIDFGSPAYNLKNENGGGIIYFMSDWNKYLTKNSPFYWPYTLCVIIWELYLQIPKYTKTCKKGCSG